MVLILIAAAQVSVTVQKSQPKKFLLEKYEEIRSRCCYCQESRQRAHASISYKIDYLLGRGVVASVRKRINPAMPTLLAPAFLITPTELSKVLSWKMTVIEPAGGGDQQIRDTLKYTRHTLYVCRQTRSNIVICQSL